jgi:hypothetical protein
VEYEILSCVLMVVSATRLMVGLSVTLRKCTKRSLNVGLRVEKCTLELCGQKSHIFHI